MRGKMDVMDTLGLYLSVPFCKAKCTFCNFASDAFPPERMAGYVDRLCAEIADARSFAERGGLRLPSRVDSIFVGGGTPSLLEPEQMRRLFATIREQFAVGTDAEITVEAAPGQIAGDLLEAMLAGGVNRISLGVQSFVDAEARAVGRSHTGASCLAELKRLRSAGVANLNVDLIAGLPHQTTASWAESLQQAVGSGAEHVSVYMLEVDEDSRLGRELIGPGVRYGAHAAPGESLVADLYTQACEALNAAGLQQYEISNFARAGFRSLHNCKYWTRAPYFGFGLDAHSMLHDQRGNAVRFSNGDELTPYVAGEESRELEHIDELAAWEETIFLGLRLTEGLSIAELRKGHSAARIEALLDTAKDLSRSGFMRVSSNSVALTQQGRILSSSIFGELLAVPAA
jgi:oxygen-independent coproporphyrinogen-3 oxidase